LFDEIVASSEFGYGSPISLFLQLDEAFTFSKLEDYPFKTLLGSNPKVLKMLKLLPEFAKLINFNRFYISNQKRYIKYINNVKEAFDKINIYKYIADFYGQIDKNLIVNLIPFQSNSNFGSIVGDNIYANLCGDDYPSSAVSYLFHASHEFSHGIVNPLTDKYSLIKKENNVFYETYNKMEKLGYTNNDVILNEYIIRASTIIFIAKIENDQDSYKSDITWEEKLGFIYIKDVIKSLTYYINNRNIYKTFEIYYPILVNDIVSAYKKSN
jgi:hypothetical protein